MASKIDESNSLATNESTLETDHATDYQMGSRHDPERKRGHCLILNYQDKRIGSEEDVQTLSATFRHLNFDVSVHQNLTKPQTEKVLIEESELDHEKYHCFVLCLLSQGSVGKFQCSDSQDFEYEKVFDYLDECRSLKGKPKLYFIDAACSEQTANQGSIGTFGGATLVPLPDNLFTKPLNSHSFAFYSSSSRHFGEESPLKGSSWFVQDLCTVLNQFANKGDDLYEMASKVNRKLANRESKSEQGKMASNSNVKQISRYLSTLTRDVRF